MRNSRKMSMVKSYKIFSKLFLWVVSWIATTLSMISLGILIIHQRKYSFQRMEGTHSSMNLITTSEPWSPTDHSPMACTIGRSWLIQELNMSLRSAWQLSNNSMWTALSVTMSLASLITAWASSDTTVTQSVSHMENNSRRRAYLVFALIWIKGPSLSH